MSDNEDDERDVRLPDKAKVIHFGTLEAQEQERQREEAALKASGAGDEEGDAAQGPASKVAAGRAAGNIVVGEAEYMELDTDSREQQEAQERLLEALDEEKRAKAMALPTSDKDVRAKLRALGEPITLFGEGPGDRRERLRQELMRVEKLGGQASNSAQHALAAVVEAAEAEQAPNELFYTEGSLSLKRVRQEIAQHSLNRARKRLAVAREESNRVSALYRAQYTELEEAKKAKLKIFAHYSNSASQIGDERPLTSGRINPVGTQFATVSWTGTCKLWHLPSCKHVVTLRGHTERTTSVDFHPASGCGLSLSAANLVTASVDNTARLWAVDGSPEPLATLQGHTDRLNHARFHPHGRLVGTTSFDETWMLWDLARGGECILEQEGHSMPVYGLAFHPDGSLAGTTGLDCLTRLWDMRSGKGVQVLEGHMRQVLAIDFSPNGYTVATGSDDHTIKIWDLRRKKCVFTIAAHSHLISSVRFDRDNGWFLMSSSYDGTCKVFSCDNWAPLKTLGSSEKKVTSVDASPDGKIIATTSFDRTWNLWELDELAAASANGRDDKPFAKFDAKPEESKPQPMADVKQDE